MDCYYISILQNPFLCYKYDGTALADSDRELGKMNVKIVTPSRLLILASSNSPSTVLSQRKCGDYLAINNNGMLPLLNDLWCIETILGSYRCFGIFEGALQYTPAKCSEVIVATAALHMCINARLQ